MIRQVGENSYRAVETWQCLYTEREASERTLWDRRIEIGGIRDRYWPFPVDVRRMDRYPDTLHTTFHVFYESLDWVRFLERNPNLGVRIVRASLGVSLPNTDIDGNVISGRDHTDKTGRTMWEITKGRSATPYPHAVIRVFLMTRNVQYINLFLGAIGKVSKGSMPHFYPYNARGELMLVAIRSTPRLIDPDIEAVSYDFIGREGGWRDSGLSRQFGMKVYQEPLYDVQTGDVIDGAYSRIARWVPTLATRKPNFYAAHDFLLIDSSLSWYMG